MLRLLLVVVIAGCGASPAPAPVVASNTADTAGQTPAPAHTLAGTYIAKHPTMVMCEDGRGVECEEAGEDHLVISESGDGTLAIQLETLGTNYHTCTFEGTLKPLAAGQRYQHIAPLSPEEEACELTLDVTATQLTITAAGCNYYCGMRASLDSTFPRP